MDPFSAIGAVVAVLTFAGTIFGVVKAYGALQQTVKDQGADLAAQRADVDKLEERVKQAEETAIQVGGLAKAVEHMGERFTDQLRHLVEVMDINNKHTREQLGDIKAQLKKSGGP